MKKKTFLTEEELDKRVSEARNKVSYFVYSEDRKELYLMAIGIEELSYFLNRQAWRVKKDLENIRRKRKTENKLIKDKNNNLYTIISEEELRIGGI